MAQSSTKEYRAMPELINVKRNPYLLDYEEQRRLREVTGQTAGSRRGTGQGGYAKRPGQTVQRPVRGQTDRTVRYMEEDVQQRPARRQVRPFPQQPAQRRPQREIEVPYLQEDMEIHRRNSQTRRQGRNAYGQEGMEDRRPVQAGQYGGSRRPRRPEQYGQSRQSEQYGRSRRPEQAGYPVRASRPVQARQGRPEQAGMRTARGQGNPYRDNARAAVAARQRRKKKVLYQRLAVGIWTMCICLLAVVFFFWNGNTSAAEPGNQDVQDSILPQEPEAEPKQQALVQGLPATEYAKHPDWTENFLTPNEYSRPGDPLTKVTNIFVHYTANPGTSAAQNRSYFEQQKDTHERSVSSHFIIGYEGEILQCVPLDEIAYAVATRNEDSISIECCFTAEDGSFTQETYDSLISLLAWLTDVYDLETEDILRHYDCGGKKCPLYYTNHPDAWEKLKQDVAQAREL